MLHNVDLAIWILEYLTAPIELQKLLPILVGNGSQELRWTHILIEVVQDRRGAVLAHSEAFETTLSCITHWSRLSIHQRRWSLTFNILPRQLLKRCEQYLLSRMQWEISVFAFLAGIDTHSTDDELLLGIDLHELLLPRDFVAKR